MNITVIGSGYVGLVTGTCLAEVGNHVCCMDVDVAKIAMLKKGKIPIYEPGLEEMVARNVAAGRLFFTDNVKESVEFGYVQFIAVGTPPDEDGSADLQYVVAAASNIALHMQDYKVVVDKSTVPVGTADKVREKITQALNERQSKLTFSVVSNPEFLKEGAAIEDFMKPDRVVVGVEDEQAEKTMKRLYEPFQRNHDRLLVMDVRSAELTKYAANSMLATRISFMNELANLAETLGADIENVRKGIGSDPRIGYDFLYAGTGYGGSCFPKDVKALISTGKENLHAMTLLTAVKQVNDVQKLRLVDKVVKHFGDNLKGKHFAMWGLAFKPNTDDMREAPSRVIISELTKRGAIVQAFDPAAMEEAKRVMGNNANLRFCPNMALALEGANALLVVTEWKVFRAPDWGRVKTSLKAPVIFDGRNMYDPAWMRQNGFIYHAIGR